MELEFLQWLRQRLPLHPQLKLGPGDDAAVLALRARPECLVTVDLLSDGVDFDLRQVDPRRVGRKCLAVNLSDIAAMAGRPLAAVIALLLPGSAGASPSRTWQGAKELAVELYEGLLPLAEKYDVPIAGGDINTWNNPLAVSVTLIGELTGRGPLLRGGAKPGDWLLVTGSLGGSILGRHLDFEPRVREALLLHEQYELHAGIDISDGLALDLSRLAAESKLGATLRTEDIPISPDAVRLSEQLADGSMPIDHALGDGEDFELLLAVPPAEAQRLLADQPLNVPITAIGELHAEPGLWRVDSERERRPLEPRGWVHS
jgi:thiamine-monophosphate kinase